MAFCLSKLSRDRLKPERQAELVALGASRIMHSRHLTGHAVHPVVLDGGDVSCGNETARRPDASTTRRYLPP